MKSAEEWHHQWAADNYYDERLMEMLRAVQRDALDSAAKVCCDKADRLLDHSPRKLSRSEDARYLAQAIRALLPSPHDHGR